MPLVQNSGHGSSSFPGNIGSYPVHRPAPITTRIFRFGQTIPIAIPLATIAARLIHGKIRSMLLWGNGYRGFATRAEAVLEGRTGVFVTMADIKELHIYKSVHAPIRARWNYETGNCETENVANTQWTPTFTTPSRQWDCEIFRWLHCRHPDREITQTFPYPHGTLSGLWQGSYLVSLSFTFSLTASLSQVYRRPSNGNT